MAPRGSSDLGNTKPGRVNSAKHWTFTWNNGPNTMAPEELVLKLNKLGTFGFGIEKAPTTGTEHYQGWISFNKKCRPIETIGIKEIHWETMKGNMEQNIDYCRKEGKYYTNYEPFELEDDLKEGNYYEWQLDVINKINQPVNKRKVYWYYDETGGKGKSALVRHLEITKRAIGLTGGKGTDIAFMLTQYQPKDIKCVIIDLPRCSEGYVSFNIIEQIKNGKVFSPKYESKTFMFNSPHLFIFANYKPSEQDMKMLSSDRWEIIKIE